MVRDHPKAELFSAASQSQPHGTTATHNTSAKAQVSTAQHHTSTGTISNHHVSISETGKHSIAIDTGSLPVFTSTAKDKTHEKTHTRTHTLPTSLTTKTEPRLTLSTATSITTSDSKPTKTLSANHHSTGVSAKEVQHPASTTIAILIVFSLLLLSFIAFVIWKCLRSPRQRHKWKSWSKCCRCCSSRSKPVRSPPTQTPTPSSGAVYSDSQQDFIMSDLHNRPGIVNMLPRISTVRYSSTHPDTPPRKSDISGNVLVGNGNQPQVEHDGSILSGGTYQRSARTANNTNPYVLPDLPDVRPFTFNGRKP
jgi:hypothetical protein